MTPVLFLWSAMKCHVYDMAVSISDGDYASYRNSALYVIN